MGALAGWAVVAFGKIAAVLVEPDNKELGAIYARALRDHPNGEREALVEKTRSICSSGEALSAYDRFRAAVILSQSGDGDSLLLAHDLGLAAAMAGFRPGLRISMDAENQFLNKYEIRQIQEPSYLTDSSGSTKAIRRVRES